MIHIAQGWIEQNQTSGQVEKIKKKFTSVEKNGIQIEICHQKFQFVFVNGISGMFTLFGQHVSLPLIAAHLNMTLYKSDIWHCTVLYKIL